MNRKSLLYGLALGALGALCGCVFGATAAVSAEPQPGAYVAEWKGGGLTVQDFLSWWQYGPQGGPQPLNTLQEKQTFLDTVINAKLMMDEADSLGISDLPTVADFWKGRRVGMLVELVQTRATQGRINVDSAAVDQVYRKRLTEMDVKQITVKTRELAASLEDSIKAGVPFEDLAKRYSTSPTGERGGDVGKVRYGDFLDAWSQVAFQLEPGQVSDPFKLQGEYYILKAYSKTLAEPADPANERKRIRGNLEQQEIIKERTAYLDSLRMAYSYNVDMAAVVNLCADYARKIESLGQQTTVVDQDVTPDLTASQRKVPVVTFKDKTITVGDVVDAVQRLPFQVRPPVDDPDGLLPQIEKQATDSLLVMEARKLGLDQDPNVVGMIDRARRRKTLFAFYDYITRDATVPPEEARAVYDANPDQFRVSEGWTFSKIVVSTKEAADSVLMRLNRGEPFEDIARVRSRDPFTAPGGGDAGFMKVGDDPEFDGFLATMQVGEKKEFRSLEGYVVLWLREKHSARRATFDEALPSIQQQLVQKYRDQIIEKWVTDRRAQLGVKVNTPVLESIVSKS